MISLVADTTSNLLGIMTDKDLAFRVVAEGLDIHTPISQVMTKVTQIVVIMIR